MIPYYTVTLCRNGCAFSRHVSVPFFGLEDCELALLKHTPLGHLVHILEKVPPESRGAALIGMVKEKDSVCFADSACLPAFVNMYDELFCYNADDDEVHIPYFMAPCREYDFKGIIYTLEQAEALMVCFDAVAEWDRYSLGAYRGLFSFAGTLIWYDWQRSRSALLPVQTGSDDGMMGFLKEFRKASPDFFRRLGSLLGKVLISQGHYPMEKIMITLVHFGGFDALFAHEKMLSKTAGGLSRNHIISNEAEAVLHYVDRICDLLLHMGEAGREYHVEFCACDSYFEYKPFYERLVGIANAWKVEHPHEWKQADAFALIW